MKFCLELFMFSHLQMCRFSQLIYSYIVLNYFGIPFDQRTECRFLSLEKMHIYTYMCVYACVCTLNSISESNWKDVFLSKHLYAAKLCSFCISLFADVTAVSLMVPAVCSSGRHFILCLSPFALWHKWFCAANWMHVLCAASSLWHFLLVKCSCCIFCSPGTAYTEVVTFSPVCLFSIGP